MLSFRSDRRKRRDGNMGRSRRIVASFMPTEGRYERSNDSAKKRRGV
jgi:hypothetical protein